MTKEELYYKWSRNANAEYIIPTLDAFFNAHTIVPNEFFSQNVCIPKGENRHPYADIFHEAMEDTNKIIQFEDGHAERDWTNLHLAQDRKHRIKPQEPVYEYMWYTDAGETLWMTDDEAESKDDYWYRTNETKRVRQ